MAFNYVSYRKHSARDHYATVAGCVIDGSHWSSDDLSVAIIDEALECGLIDADGSRLVAQFHADTDGTVHSTFDSYKDSDAAYEASEYAVDYLNDHVAADGMVFFVDENSLYYQSTDEAQDWF